MTMCPPIRPEAKRVLVKIARNPCPVITLGNRLITMKATMPNMEIINLIVITITKLIMSQVQPKRMVFPIMTSNTGTQLESFPKW